MTWYALDLMIELLPWTMDEILQEHFPPVKALYEAIIKRPNVKRWLETARMPPKDRSDLEGVDVAQVRARNWLILTDRTGPCFGCLLGRCSPCHRIDPSTDLAGIEAVAARDRAGDVEIKVEFASMRRVIKIG